MVCASLFTSMVFLCARTLHPLVLFLSFPLSLENMQNYVCFLKSFPLLHIDEWKDQGSVRELFDLSLCDDFTAIPLQAEKLCPCLCTSSLLPLCSLPLFVSVQFGFLLPDQDGNPTHTRCCRKTLEFWSQRSSFGFTHWCSWNGAFSQTRWALFLSSCSHIFFLFPNPCGPSCSPHRGFKKSYHRQLIAWQAVTTLPQESIADDVIEQMFVVCVSSDGSINIDRAVIVVEPLLETVAYCMNEEVKFHWTTTSLVKGSTAKIWLDELDLKSWLQFQCHIDRKLLVVSTFIWAFIPCIIMNAEKKVLFGYF